MWEPVDPQHVNVVWTEKDSAWNSHGQSCPICKIPLTCIECYASGSNLYWTLDCLICNKRYTFDTYSRSLRDQKDNLGCPFSIDVPTQ